MEGMVIGSNGGKGHFRLLVATVFAVLLAAGTSIPASAQGAGASKKVTGTAAASGQVLTAANQAGRKKGQQQQNKKPPARRRTSGKKNQAASILDETAKLPWPENVVKLAGAGAVMVMDNHAGKNEPKELYSLNPDKMYVPASILKLVTAAASMDILGADYRFQTDFALDDEGGLWVKGYGDPFLVSEELCRAVDALVGLGLRKIGNIHLDTSYFEPGLVLDGTTHTVNPYDAFNGALGVNFNTVNFLIDKQGRVVESNACTPVTSITADLAEKNKPKKKSMRAGEYRLNISESPQMAEEQSGLHIRGLLEKAGVEVTGEVVLGGVLPDDATPLYSHVNSRSLEQMLVDLLEHSNNFMTNQLFLIMGAEAYGAPATVEKGRMAVLDYLDRQGLSKLVLVEGSGLSRNNFISARQMLEVLTVFEPNRFLTRTSKDGSVFYKTGTMIDIQTLVGYITRPDRPDEPLSFVILLNGAYAPGTREKILDVLKAHFVDEPAAGTGKS
jgi:D-alanyl-D-alanine carboxypeptidase/D-alanyl-D-alanine-endopeptidase (penicillin-binding protein 4)